MSRQQSLPKTLMPFILFFVKRYRWPLLFMQLLCLAWCLDQVLWPYLFGRIVDTLNINPKQTALSQLKPLLIFSLVLWISIEVSFRLAGFIFASVIPRMQANIRMGLFNYVHQHSHRYFSERLAGSISNKISDMTNAVYPIIHDITYLFLPALVTFTIINTLFFNINPLFALLNITWIILHLGTVLLFINSISRASLVHANARSHLQGRIVDSLTNYLAVKLFARNCFELDYMSKYQDGERKKNQYQQVYIEKIKIILGVLSLLLPGIAINGFAFYSWWHGTISVGEVVQIFNTMWNLMFTVWWTALEIPNFFKEIGIMQQALELVKDNIEIEDQPDAQPLIVSNGEIIFENVSFRYKSAEPLFENLSVAISPGQKVGLVGFSGSGKTTFVNLILRMFDLQSGAIKIDGYSIAAVTQNSLREQITMIPQDPTLFHRTLLENVRYGKLDAGDEAVTEAVRQAHAEDFIMALPQGYQTLVGERGIKLSGGQRQRIAIARAILKNAPILILDEATSALDSVTEQYIQDSLAHLMQHRTVLVIAHRLSTLLHLDRILVFHQGRIVEDGSHQELITLGGLYKKMWDAQIGGFLPERIPRNNFTTRIRQ